MRPLQPAMISLALLGTMLLALVLLVGDSRAELENQVFSSRAHHLRMVVPRGWRATDQPSYPGLLLWMMRSQPPGQIVLTGEAFTRALYCSWPIACRTSPESLPAKYACALRTKLQEQRMRVGPVQPGPKETQAGGLPSVWFEYEDGAKFLRHAVAIGGDRAVSLVLAAPSNDARAAHVRPFEQALRTLRLIPVVDTAPAAVPAPAPVDVGPGAPAPMPDAGVLDEGVMFESAPAPTINPVGPCS